MTHRIKRWLRTHVATPAWAVHFHADGHTGDSTACFDVRCGRPPLSTDYRLGV
jgi:hypothetical protein